MLVLGVGVETGCARHVVVERSQVAILNQKNWTIRSAPESAVSDSKPTLQVDTEPDSKR
jgi:hypothetical protein